MHGQVDLVANLEMSSSINAASSMIPCELPILVIVLIMM